VEQLAKALDCHKNSVRTWLKRGLETLDDGKRPLLIQGSVAKRFLENRKRARKRRCKPNELFCLRCQKPRAPASQHAHYRLRPGQATLLTAACTACGTQMFKCVSESLLLALQQTFVLQLCEAAETPKLAA
jgi:hypothetical protein